MTKHLKNKCMLFDAGWRVFKIVHVKELRDGEEKCWGHTDFDKAIISMDNGMDVDTYRETLLHEITHVILETVGYGSDESVTGTNENLTVQASRGFLQAMRLNKELFKWLLNTEEDDL